MPPNPSPLQNPYDVQEDGQSSAGRGLVWGAGVAAAVSVAGLGGVAHADDTGSWGSSSTGSDAGSSSPSDTFSSSTFSSSTFSSDTSPTGASSEPVPVPSFDVATVSAPVELSELVELDVSEDAPSGGSPVSGNDVTFVPESGVTPAESVVPVGAMVVEPVVPLAESPEPEGATVDPASVSAQTEQAGRVAPVDTGGASVVVPLVGSSEPVGAGSTSTVVADAGSTAVELLASTDDPTGGAALVTTGEEGVEGEVPVVTDSDSGLPEGGVLVASSAITDSGGLSSVNTAPVPVAPDDSRLLTGQQSALVARFIPPSTVSAPSCTGAYGVSTCSVPAPTVRPPRPVIIPPSQRYGPPLPSRPYRAVPMPGTRYVPPPPSSAPRSDSGFPEGGVLVASSAITDSGGILPVVAGASGADQVSPTPTGEYAVAQAVTTGTSQSNDDWLDQFDDRIYYGQGSSGPLVRDLQLRLHRLGYLSGTEVNESYGSYRANTADAVRRFQEDNGLTGGKGAMGPNTAGAINDRIKGLRNPALGR